MYCDRAVRGLPAPLQGVPATVKNGSIPLYDSRCVATAAVLDPRGERAGAMASEGPLVPDEVARVYLLRGGVNAEEVRRGSSGLDGVPFSGRADTTERTDRKSSSRISRI